MTKEPVTTQQNERPAIEPQNQQVIEAITEDRPLLTEARYAPDPPFMVHKMILEADGLTPDEVSKEIAREVYQLNSFEEIVHFFGENMSFSIISRQLNSMISKGATKEQVEEFLNQKLILPSIAFTGKGDFFDVFGVMAKIRELAFSRFGGYIPTYKGDIDDYTSAKINPKQIAIFIRNRVNTFQSLPQIAQYLGDNDEFSTISIELDSMISKGATKEQVNTFLSRRLTGNTDAYGIKTKIRELALSWFDGTIEENRRIELIARAIDDPNHPFNKILSEAVTKQLEVHNRRTKASLRLGRLRNRLKNLTDLTRIKEVEREIEEIKRLLQVEETILEDLFSDSAFSLFGKQEPLNLRGIDYGIYFVWDSILSIEKQSEIRARIKLKIRLVERILRQIIPVTSYGLSSHLQIYVSEKITRDYVKGKLIYIHPDASLRTILHEMLHVIEMENPIIRSRARSYLESRTKGEQFVRLSEYGPEYDENELTKPDHFAHPYMGKEYEDKYTELISMFAEYLTRPEYQRSNTFYIDGSTFLTVTYAHHGFIRRDPDYVRFILDVLMDPRSYEWSETWRYTDES